MAVVPQNHVEVIGALLDQAVVAGGPSEPGTGSIPLLDVDGSWCLGTDPCRFILTAGDNTEIPATLLTPETPKALRIGDGQAAIEIMNLWVETADPDQADYKNAQTRFVLNDRRIWWHRRPPYGPRAYNAEQFNERQTPFNPSSSARFGSNPRYAPYSVRTGEQIIREIMAWLGENQQNVKLDGSGGWANLSVPMSASGISPLADTPEWVMGEGATPVEALEKFCAMYDLYVGISYKDMSVGFIRRGDIPAKLSDTYDKILNLQGVHYPVEALSVGWDLEGTPDALWITGSPVVIGDYLVLEAVCRDPDRPERFIPLNQISTLEAYGFDMSITGRDHLRDGRGASKFATVIALMEDAPNEVPPRYHSYIKEWFRLWQVAMPRELILEGIGTTRERPGVEPRAARKLDKEVDSTTGAEYQRWRAPLYRFKRGQASGSFRMINDVESWEAGADSTEAELHRWLPLLPHTAEMMSDGSYGKLEVFGFNTLRPARPKSHNGQAGYRWVQIGAVKEWQDRPTEFKQLEALGLEPVLVDPELGIVDLGESVFGHYSGEGKLIPERTRGGRSIPDLFSTEFLSIRARAGEEPGMEDPPTDSSQVPIGEAFLILKCAYHKKSAGTTADTSSARSTVPSSRSGDAWSGQPSVIPGMIRHLYSGVDLPSLPVEPSRQRQYPWDVAQTALPDIELRCWTGRAHPETLTFDLSFSRNGGHNSGSLDGLCRFSDLRMTTSSAVAAGEFAPVSQSHYEDIFRALSDVIRRSADAIELFRRTESNIKSVNAEIHGIHRRFFAGDDDYEANPVDSIQFSGSGDNVSVRMRVAANSRGWRPYVNSAVANAARNLAGHRAGSSLIHSIMRGGGI